MWNSSTSRLSGGSARTRKCPHCTAKMEASVSNVFRKSGEDEREWTDKFLPSWDCTNCSVILHRRSNKPSAGLTPSQTEAIERFRRKFWRQHGGEGYEFDRDEVEIWPESGKALLSVSIRRTTPGTYGYDFPHRAMVVVGRQGGASRRVRWADSAGWDWEEQAPGAERGSGANGREPWLAAERRDQGRRRGQAPATGRRSGGRRQRRPARWRARQAERSAEKRRRKLQGGPKEEEVAALRVASGNCRGWERAELDLREFLMKEEIHILALQETWASLRGGGGGSRLLLGRQERPYSLPCDEGARGRRISCAELSP